MSGAAQPPQLAAVGSREPRSDDAARLRIIVLVVGIGSLLGTDDGSLHRVNGVVGLAVHGRRQLVSHVRCSRQWC